MNARRLLPIVALVFFGCQFEASCGGKTLNMDKAREFIATTLEKESGQKPEVTCPDSVKIEKGKTFECTATFGATRVTVVIMQDDDQGNVTIQAITGLIIIGKLEKIMADDLGKQLKVQLTIKCGDRVRASTPGEKFTCEASDPTGQSGMVTVTVKDDKGNVSYEIGGGAPQ